MVPIVRKIAQPILKSYTNFEAPLLLLLLLLFLMLILFYGNRAGDGVQTHVKPNLVELSWGFVAVGGELGLWQQKKIATKQRIEATIWLLWHTDKQDRYYLNTGEGKQQ